jgi:copper resistance protein D
MDWFGGDSDGPLIAARAIHFAATAITAGTLVFAVVVAKPVLRCEEAEARQFRSQNRMVAWVGLAVVLASGAIWFFLESAQMSGVPLSGVMNSSLLQKVVNETQFGHVAEIRLALAIVLAACLAASRRPLADGLALAAAIGLTAAVAWTGHAAGTLGDIGDLHLIADGLHLVAAAAWIGGLVSLVLLLGRFQRGLTVASASRAEAAVRRFSILGIIAVATLLVTGAVNAWILVGSFPALTVTEYGRTLMLKTAVFATMLAFAAVNRLWLTPRLVASSGTVAGVEALRQLTRNSAIEIALGLAIFIIVGMLGTLHPAIHFFS